MKWSIYIYKEVPLASLEGGSLTLAPITYDISMTFVPKSNEIDPRYWKRSVYHLEKVDSVIYFLGKERGL